MPVEPEKYDLNLVFATGPRLKLLKNVPFPYICQNLYKNATLDGPVPILLGNYD